MKLFFQKMCAVLATGLGLGLAPKMPGTFGTILGIPLFLVFYSKGNITYLALTVLFSFLSVVVVEFSAPLFKGHDNQKIVIDEVVGYLISMAMLPNTWQAIIAGFIGFRFFDALKPGPIGYLDRKIKGSVGIVTDDIAAGIATNILLQIIFTNTNWLN